MTEREKQMGTARPPRDRYDGMPIGQLLSEARTKGIPNPDSMSERDLKNALRTADAAGATGPGAPPAPPAPATPPAPTIPAQPPVDITALTQQVTQAVVQQLGPQIQGVGQTAQQAAQAAQQAAQAAQTAATAAQQAANHPTNPPVDPHAHGAADPHAHAAPKKGLMQRFEEGFEKSGKWLEERFYGKSSGNSHDSGHH